MNLMKMEKYVKLILLIFVCTASGCALLKDSNSLRSGMGMKPKTELDVPPAKFEAKDSKNWKYGSRTDPMDNVITYMAVNYSKNKVNLSFPYQGGTQAQIAIIKFGNSRSVSIEVTKGQISFNHIAIGRLEEMRVKFGENNLKSYEIKAPKNSKNDFIVIYDENDFIRNLNQNKTVTIEIRFFRDGIRTFDFDTEGLQKFFLE